METTLPDRKPAQGRDEWLRAMAKRSSAINADYAAYVKRRRRTLLEWVYAKLTGDRKS